MTTKKVAEIDRGSLSELIARVEHAIEHELALSVEDMKLLLHAITTLCTLQANMEQDDITLHKLRKLLGMIKQSEKRSQNRSQSKSKNKSKHKKPRVSSTKSAKAPQVVYHKMMAHHKGDVCPACSRGKLYKFEPNKLLRITGHARYEAVHHIVEQLRCNACEQLYKAPLPESVLADGDAEQNYGYTARALMVIDKFFTGIPYYHQSTLACLLGYSITASTIYDQCEYVANDVIPVVYELKRLSADAPRLLIDDTRHRILTQQPELRDRPNGKGQQLRTGVYCSGLIAILADGHEIILFETSLGHAGEHLAGILEKRAETLPPPVVMCDASSSNGVVNRQIILCYCNAHARRQFFDLEKIYPKDIGWVLDTYGKIWEHEETIRAEEMNDAARLVYHQTHSLPVMKSLYDWALNKRNGKAFEEHSAYGKAINYFLKHYDNLVKFCEVEGAYIDNNRMEEKLKIPIRGRKTAHFFKTVNGAGVGNVLTSLLATTAQASENVYDYFVALQKHRDQVKAEPAAWLPWTYRNTLAKLSATAVAPPDSS